VSCQYLRAPQHGDRISEKGELGFLNKLSLFLSMP